MAARSRRRALLAAGLSLVLALLLAEVGFRVAAPSLGISLDEMRRASKYLLDGEGGIRPHPYEVLVRDRDAAWQSATGLQDEKRTQAKVMPRVLCLGGSTTEGGNIRGFRGAYPRYLLHVLTNDYGIIADVLNGGMSGWCTAETVIAYFLDYQDFDPDVVLIHHAINDVAPQISPGFRSDYSHWRTPLRQKSAAWIERPLVRFSLLYTYLCRPEQTANSIALATKKYTREEKRHHKWEIGEQAARTYRRNVESIGGHAEAHGAVVGLVTLPWVHRGPADRFTAGIEQNNEALRQIASDHGWILVDLERHFVEKYTEEQRQAGFLDRVHVKPAGNEAKAQEIARVLVEAGVFESSDTTR